MFDINKKHEIIIKKTMRKVDRLSDIKGRPIKKIPFAGVGSPKKYVFVGNTLNLANLIIEKGTIRNDAKDKITTESFDLVNKSNVKKAGASENVIRSENESSCIPILDLTLKTLAIYPSKKSKTAPSKTKTKTNSYLFKNLQSLLKMQTMAKQPHIPFRIVRKFGSILINFNSQIC